MQRRSFMIDRFPGFQGGSAIVFTVPVVVVVAVALFFGRPFFLPVIVAVLLNFMLSPLVSTLRRLSIPAPLSAAIVIVGCIGVVGYGLYRIVGPAADLVETLPTTLVRVESKIRGLRSSIDKVAKTSEKIEDITSAEGETRPMEVTTDKSFTASVAEGTGPVVFGTVVAIFLLFFLLSSGGRFLRKLVHVLPDFAHKRSAVTIVRRTEREVSRYILTITVINAGLGAAVGGVFWLIGFPSPFLWGVIVALLNFVPYMGGMVGVAAITVVSVLTFDTVGTAIWPPIVYLTLNSVESFLITPALLGQQFRLDPVAVLIAVVFWTWIWGVPGAILAVPLLVVLKITCDNVKTLSAVGVFLGR